MSVWRIAAVTVAIVVLSSGMRGAVFGQSIDPYYGGDFGNPRDAQLELGPLALAPAVRLWGFGYDSNVFSRPESQNPRGDLTGTLTPAVTGWLRLPGVRVTGRTELDFIYFRELSSLRSLDTDNAVRAELLFNRLTPYVAAQFLDNRHRLNVEIDAPIRAKKRELVLGTDLRLTGKSSANVRMRNTRIRYDEDATYLGNDLSELLTRTTEGEGFTYWYSATPLTTIGVDVERRRDRFRATPERDSDQVRLSTLVTFLPDALIEGRARFGIYRRRSTNRVSPETRGGFFSMDLRYTLLGRTRLSIRAEHDLEYSYRVQEQEYQLTGFTASVTQLIGDSWHVRGSVGRERLAYVTIGQATPDPDDPFPDLAPPRETVSTYRFDVGHRVGPTRLGFEVMGRGRSSDELTREFERVRIGSSVTYVFD